MIASVTAVLRTPARVSLHAATARPVAAARPPGQRGAHARDEPDSNPAHRVAANPTMGDRLRKSSQNGLPRSDGCSETSTQRKSLKPASRKACR